MSSGIADKRFDEVIFEEIADEVKYYDFMVILRKIVVSFSSLITNKQVDSKNKLDVLTVEEKKEFIEILKKEFC